MNIIFVNHIDISRKSKFQFGGGFMLKAPGFQMVEENSKYSPSYFYQINHSIRKSLFYFLFEGDTPYLRNAELGLPGEIIYNWKKGGVCLLSELII